MSALKEFLQMGGFAIYVWPAYLFTAFVLFAMVYYTITPLRRSTRDLARHDPQDHET